jgi:hypothetical protein
MNKFLKFFIITAATAVTIASVHAEPDQPTQTLFKNLMAATVSNNYDGFISECNDVMKAGLTKPMLEGVSKQIEPRARQGYEAHYLGELNQRGYKVHLWRLNFKDAGDDVLATLSVKDGKAGGFYLH